MQEMETLRMVSISSNGFTWFHIDIIDIRSTLGWVDTMRRLRNGGVIETVIDTGNPTLMKVWKNVPGSGF